MNLNRDLGARLAPSAAGASRRAATHGKTRPLSAPTSALGSQPHRAGHDPELRLGLADAHVAGGRHRRDGARGTHAAGLKVIPWTVDDVPPMEALMDRGVDGLITGYPNRLRDLMASRGMRLPRRYPAPI